MVSSTLRLRPTIRPHLETIETNGMKEIGPAQRHLTSTITARLAVIIVTIRMRMNTIGLWKVCIVKT